MSRTLTAPDWIFPESSKKTSWRATGSRAFVSQVREDTYRRLA